MRILRPLVLGEDQNLSKKLTDCLQKHFHRVYVQNDANLFRQEVSDINPDILFLNFSIGQSELSHQMLRWLSSRQVKMIIFGFYESSHSEVLAHGIELGIEENFSSPFNEEEIIKKVKEIYLPTNQKERVKLNPPISGKITFNLEVVSVDENGLKLSCSHYISKGTCFDFTDPLAEQIFGKPQVPMMVTKTSQVGTSEGGYEIFVEPKENSETHILSLRRFIMSK